MSAVDKTPTNKNFLSPLNFTFVLKRSPHLNFFVQRINIPAITLAAVETPSPLLRIPYGGDHILYDQLTVTFKVDEDLKNYLEVHNWIRAIGYPETQEEYKALSSKEKASGEWLKSDISVILADGLKQPNFEVVFKDAFPVSLSELEFNTTDADVDYITATASFGYTFYTITKL